MAHGLDSMMLSHKQEVIKEKQKSYNLELSIFILSKELTTHTILYLISTMIKLVSYTSN